MVIVPAPGVIVMFAPAVRLATVYPEPFPIGICPLVGIVATPVPPFATVNVPLMSATGIVAEVVIAPDPALPRVFTYPARNESRAVALGIEASGTRTMYVPAEEAPPASPGAPCGPIAPARLMSEPMGITVPTGAFRTLNKPGAGFWRVN